MTKIYKGKRLHNGTEVEVWEEQIIKDGDTIVRPLKRIRLLKVYGFHSPTGFEWGYGGSGPGELALAILLDHFDELPSSADLYIGLTEAQIHHQDFKWAFIAGIDRPSWEISSEDIESWLQARNAAGLFGSQVRVAS